MLCWVFVSVRGLSPVAASGDHSSSRCAGLSLSRPPPLRSTGSRRAGSVIVAHGPSRSAACGIFPGQGSNPCPLHWQADSQPLRHQGSPLGFFLMLGNSNVNGGSREHLDNKESRKYRSLRLSDSTERCSSPELPRRWPTSLTLRGLANLSVK